MDGLGMGIAGMQDALSFATTNASQSGKNISQLKNGKLENASDKELMDACKEFEAYFLEQMFKEMSKTVMSSDESGSNGSLVSFFKDQTLTSIAKDSTEQNSLGLANMLYEQMKRNNVVPEVSELSDNNVIEE